MTLYFVDGGDIPYVALSEYMQFLSGLFKELEKGDITYEIDIIASDDECYIPFQTMNDLLENHTYVLYVFDGEKVWHDQVPGYEEEGDTAFITFDSFDRLREDYYDPEIDRDQPQDTIDLIIYAHNQIKRKDSPVKNIVLDLSNNYGGSLSSAIFVTSWFLGEADIALRDVFTGAETNAVYLADVNLDGQFNEDDTVGTGYNLYCLTSRCSFSCGNLVAAACSSSGKVTLVGQTTGGGPCAVLPCTTAAGAVFRISGPMQISIIKNGSFYNTDSGIVPHFFLDKPESYYDRPALAEYLRELK